MLPDANKHMTHRAPRPTSLVFRGVIHAAGILISTNLIPEAEARQRILALWTVGAAVYRTRAGLLLLFPEPREVVCEKAPGLPVVRNGAALLACPLRDSEIARLPVTPDCVVLCRDGLATVIAVSEDQREDVSRWLPIENWSARTVTSLGALPAPPTLVTEPAPFSARERIPGIPKPSPDREEALAALRLALAGKAPPDKGHPSFQAVVGRGLQKLAATLKSWPAAQSSGGQPSRPGTAGDKLRKGLAASPALYKPPGLSWKDRLADRMNELAARLLVATGMAESIGRKQAEYVERMMRMFEQEALDEALRHAIGLNDLAEDAKPRPPLLTTPTPRADLTISAGTAPARSSLHADNELFAQLRALYRKAYEKLAAEGRIDEAAFTLAELLNAHEEAVAFLEKHGRLSLAAEMAEARSLPPGLIVRLWFAAGDHDRAARLAWKTGAFADAVNRMQRVDPAKARDLRLFWAASLVQAGSYAAAVEVLWPDSELRPHAGEWIDRAIDLGGPVAGRMLALKISQLGALDGASRRIATELLEDERQESAPVRREFIAQIARSDSELTDATLNRLAARSALRDAGAMRYSLGKLLYARLIKLSNDGALRIDMPPLPAKSSPSLRSLTTPEVVAISAGDRGAMAVHDAVTLPGGLTLAALGESGVRLLTADGRTIVHWDRPATHLVVSEQGDRALALIKRGEIWQITRIDILSRRAVFWQDAALSAFAQDFDGALWFVALEDVILGIHTVAEGFDALWREPKLGGRVAAIARSSLHLTLLLEQTAHRDDWGRSIDPQRRLERRTYALPQIVLRDRNELPTPPPELNLFGSTVLALGPEGQAIQVSCSVESERQAGTGGETPKPMYFISISDPAKGTLFREQIASPATALPLVLNDSWALVSTLDDAGACCRLMDRKEWRARARIDLGGSERVSARILGTRCTVSDNLGRLIAIDLESGEVLRNFRIRA